jgi:hypothetical protein
MNPYIGHSSQLYGVEEHRLIGGKGDGMRLFEVFNGKGLQMTVSPDRCADISRLRYKGINIGYFSPCGYVAPAYYDPDESRWLKSFTAGFLTTCGLEAVGSPCVDEGEKLPLHGSIANIPAEHAYWAEESGRLVIRALMLDEAIFARKLRLMREISVSLDESVFSIADTVENGGESVQPLEILYHMNIGYPMLDEDSVVMIPSERIVPRDNRAAAEMASCLKMEKPQAGYKECCYYHALEGETAQVSIYQPKLNTRLSISYAPDRLDCFTEWKMMGIRDYALGLECGNCYPDGRGAMRKKGILKYIDPGESVCYRVEIKLSNEAALF